MGSFSDSQGRTWAIDLTVGSVKDIRSRLKIDLLDLGEETFTRLADDVILMHDLIWQLCEKEAKSRDVDEEDFGRAVVGQPLADAIGVVLEAIPAFFHGQKKSLIEKAVRKTRAIRTKAEEMAAETLDDSELEQKMVAAMGQAMKRGIEEALTQLSLPTS